MAKLDISNIIRVTLLSALRGLADVNTSALALITDEVPIPGNFGDSQIYLSPDGVADDFGSTSATYRLAQGPDRAGSARNHHGDRTRRPDGPDGHRL